jgi:peptide subunit release factor 1 (eRF1)
VATTIEERSAYRQTIKCLSCDTIVRVYRVVSAPTTQIGTLQYCPVCASEAKVLKDDDLDYWEILAENYDMPIEIIKQLYEMWDSKVHPRFGDFVKDFENG